MSVSAGGESPDDSSQSAGKVLRWLYSALLYLLTPFILLRLLLRSIKAPDYRHRWGERFGFVPLLARPPKGQPVFWIHSVSVGETLAALPLIKSLQQHYPQARLVVTTTTPTGSARVREALGKSVYHVYAPYDLPGTLRRFHRRVQPNVLVIMETELWPNLIHSCAQHNVSVVLANARLSEKSAAGYRRFSGLTQPMLQKISCIAAQHGDDAHRFAGLGTPESRLEVTGNIKFDLNIDDDIRQKASHLKQEWQGSEGRQILLVASTHRGEDGIVLDAFSCLQKQFPKLLLVLVPRHPERFSEVATLCEKRGFSVARRSEGKPPEHNHHILLGDTMGELLVFFGACDIAFVAGSLVPVGGHNLIEPAAWGVPVLSGPQLFNFAEASRLLLAAEGMAICESAEEMESQVVQLLSDPKAAARMGAAAGQVARENRGALDRLIAVIERQL